MNPIQVRMARAALDLTLDQLASRAGVSHVEMAQIETGGAVGTDAVQRLKGLFEDEGIEWIGEDGVRYKGDNGASQAIPIDELTTENDK